MDAPITLGWVGFYKSSSRKEPLQVRQIALLVPFWNEIAPGAF
jgi:hypothetical protein